MSRRVQIDDLHDFRLPEQPALAPDGNRVAYVLRTVDRDHDRDERCLWTLSLDDAIPRRLTRGRSDTSPVWSPDGDRIAFLRRTDDVDQVWVLPLAGGEAERLTDLPLGAGAPVWSPDGTRLAFSAPVDAGRSAGATDDRAGSGPVVSESVLFKMDGAGFLGGVRQHLHVVEVASGRVQQVTRGDWMVEEPVWSPNGTELAFAAARDLDTERGFWAPAYVVSALGERAIPRLVGPEQASLGVVGWGADGASLLAVGRADTELGHAHLLRLSCTDATVTNLCPDLDRNLMPGGPGYPGARPQVIADGTIVFCVRDQGCTHLYAVPVDGGESRCVVGGAQQVSGLAVAGSTAVAVLSTPTTYGEIVSVDLAGGAITPRTEFQPEHLDLFVPEERSFTTSDGTVVQGWLVRDPKVSGPRPLLLDVHGGPHNAWNGVADPAHLYHQVLASRGWVVLLLNPRGSDGYGEEFFTAAIGGWGRDDVDDFLEPVDALVAEGAADPDRLAVTGYSYGGYVTCYLTSRDDRFAAAVAGGAVTDLTSMSGTSDAGHHLQQEFGGTPWSLPADFAEMSPLARVADVRTPTLLVHGADDLRCPLGQAEQWFTALRELEVPTRLVTYPGASHLFILAGTPSHRADWNRRVVDWVEEYAVGAGKPRRVALDRAHWQQRLAELASVHDVPGATLGILRLGDERVLAHHGVLSTATGVDVTDDTLFQIGSITKVWTATMVMQLVDEGRLDLDAPLVEVLPELRVADTEVSRQVTMRHLLTHTSGIDGDVFTDTGRGDDCLAGYVAALSEVAQNHPLGATFSYCNSGFILAGGVIEKITGQTWDTALRERLITPLGLTHTVTLPEEALMFRAAVGHVRAGENAPQPAPVWTLPRSAGPAGLITATASDVLDFAALHLNEGKAPDGTQLLGAEAARQMTEHEVDIPDPYILGDSLGLGWIRFGWGSDRLIGHDGNTIGQSAFLRILPELGLAVTLLTNGGNARDLYAELFAEIFSQLGAVDLPAPFAPPAEPPRVDGSAYVGVYERASARIEVFESDDGLRARDTVTGPLAELMPNPVQEYDLVPVSDTVFAYRPEGMSWVSAVFYQLPSGETYLHTGVRGTPKVT